MSFTYRYLHRGVVKEHHAEIIEGLIERALCDIDQDRATPLEIREGQKVKLISSDLTDLWTERAEQSYWAV